MAAWGLWSPVAAASADVSPQLTQQEEICRDFLKSVSDLWFLLSGISSRADADAQAEPFRALVHRICLLDEKLSGTSTTSGLPAEVEAEVHEDAATAEAAETLDALQLRILESFDDVNAEFLSLCRVQCYGSPQLAKVFAEAADTGMFAEDALALLHESRRLNAKEAEEELVRLRHLEEPDRAMLRILEQVKDAASAQKAVAALTQLSERFKALLPPQETEDSVFSDAGRAKLSRAYEPISPLLWGIRTELVRIAALPGYDSESYDRFSDALNTVFDDLGATHRSWFDDVFDASFRADLDDAVMENPSSTATD